MEVPEYNSITSIISPNKILHERVGYYLLEQRLKYLIWVQFLLYMPLDFTDANSSHFFKFSWKTSYVNLNTSVPIEFVLTLLF